MTDKRDPITGQPTRATPPGPPRAAAGGSGPRVLLIIAQRPEQELNALLQVLGSQGIGIDQAAAQQRGTSWPLRTSDGGDAGRVTLYPELGIFRVLLSGPRAASAEQLVANYLPVMQPEAILAQAEAARSAMEQQVFGVMAVLAFVDAHTAMTQAGNALMASGNEGLQQGVVQGLLLLESPDAQGYLEKIARDHQGKPIGELANRGLAMLAEQGLAAETPETLITRAREAFDKGEYEAAIELVGPLLDSPAAPTEALLIAARALRALGRHEDLLQFVPRPAAGPGAAEVMTERALSLERLGQLDEASQELRAALELEPDLAPAKAARQRIELVRDSASQTAEQKLARLDAAIENNPDDGALYLQRAGVRMQTGHAAEALADLADAEKHGIEDTAALETLRAEAALAARHYADALRAATRAAAHPEALPDKVSLLRGRAYLALDEPERAAQAFAVARREEPTLAAEATLGRGLALELVGRTDDARACYKEALADGAHGPDEMLARLKPVVYKPVIAWSEVAGGHNLAPQQPPASKVGEQTIDPLFKVCIECGSPALARRTSCRDCGGRDFVR